MKTIGSFEAKTHFGQILNDVRQGDSFLVTLRGKPVARIIPEIPENNHPCFGSEKGKIFISPDFDEPLSDFAEYES